MKYSKIYILKTIIVFSVLIVLCPVQAEMTLCDCVNKPMDTDAKLASCSEIFDSLDPDTSAQQRRECRNKPPPADGPDKCYCLKSHSQDPEVRKICEAMLENMSEAELMKDIRGCAGKSF